MGDPYGSSLFLKNCTPWKESMLKQFLRNCSSQKRPTEEKFMKSFLSWEGLRAEAEKESGKEKKTEMKGYDNLNFPPLWDTQVGREG